MVTLQEILKTKTDFVNGVKITEAEGLDYVFHFYNSYSGKAWVFMLHKELFDKGMEIRKIIPLEIRTSEEIEEEIKNKKDKKDNNGVKIYS